MDRTPQSIHLVDPELRDFIELLQMPELTSENLAAVRERHSEIRRRQMATAATTFCAGEQRFIPGPRGAPEVRVLIFKPKTAKAQRPAYLFMHGGGYVMGAPEFSERRNRALAERFDCVVVTPSYRRAPETPFPGAIEDCYATLRWLYDGAEELGVDRRRIVVGGESAGGGLAASLALLARDRGEFSLAGQVLVAPMLDDSTGSTRKPAPYAGEFIWTAQSNRFAWTSLLGREPGGEDVCAYAAPARATELAGLPPACIFTGALDLFMEEDIEFARRLMNAGVPTALQVYAGAYHGFGLAQATSLAQRFQRDCEEALERCLRAGSAGSK